MKKQFAFFIVGLLSMTVSCDTLKTLPTNTTGGVFSLNGTWLLASTTDSNSLVGTTITVVPGIGAAIIKEVTNNTYCLRKNDQVWKNIKANAAGGFTLDNLVSACNGSNTYNAGTVSVVTSDKITVTSRTAGNTELIQAFDKVK